MGRKKKEKEPLRKVYFEENEEMAVKEYILAKTQEEKNKIYNDKLREPLRRLIEAIIKTYNLYRTDISMDELEMDALSFLITKFDKFDHNLNAKAYSYYGTICKHYLMSQLVKYSKNRNRNISYEDVSSDIEENPEMSYELNDAPDVETIEFIKVLSKKISDELNSNKKFKPNEIKVGIAIIEILENWEKLFSNGEKSNVLARNRILYEIREATFLTPKEVRNALTKFKSMYFLLKEKVYSGEKKVE